MDAHDPGEDQCGSQRTVQVGPLAAIDLRCTMLRKYHYEPVHSSSRTFGDVTLSAKWPGAFEDPDE